MSLENSNKRVKVEVAKRISDWKQGGAIWDSTWHDVTEYFIEIVTDYNFSIDDNNLTGKYSQESINIKFSNREGTFNGEAVKNSLWRKGEYMYHSRLRLYEWYELDKDEPESDDLIIDGLIAVYYPSYYLNGDINILVNSKLDILREHYLVTENNKKNIFASSQGVLNYIIDLYNVYYSELDVEFDGCVFFNSIDFSGLYAYNDNLLDLFYRAIDSGGGYGGMINNVLFSSFVGASKLSGFNFTETNFPISIYHFDDTDKLAGTTVADKIGSNDLATIDDWTTGLFDNATRNFLLYDSGGIFININTEYSIEMVIKITNNKLFPINIPLVFSASSSETGLYPVIAFSNDTTTSAIVIADYASAYEIEGYFLDNRYKVYYGRGAISGNSFGFSFIEELGQLDTDNMYQYLAFSHNSSGDISFFKNGRFVNGFRDSSSGSVMFNPLKRKRMAGYGYYYRLNGASSLEMLDTCRIEYSGLKINYKELTEDNCFDTYINLFSRQPA